MSPAVLNKNAIKELKNIKKYATGEELGRLLTRLDNLSPMMGSACVYGLMTGDCFSDRAIELIKLCTVKSYISQLSFPISMNKTVKNFYRGDGIRNFSNLEYYITKKDKKSNIKFILKHLS